MEHVVTDHPSCASTTYVMCCVQYHQVYSTLGYSTGLDLSLMMSFLILPSESDQNSGYTTINNSAYSSVRVLNLIEYEKYSCRCKS